MAKRKDDKGRQPPRKKDDKGRQPPRKKDDKGRQPPRKKDKELEAIYEKSRREFSAADLQKFTVVEKAVPLKKVIKEMEKSRRPTNLRRPEHGRVRKERWKLRGPLFRGNCQRAQTNPGTSQGAGPGRGRALSDPGRLA